MFNKREEAAPSTDAALLAYDVNYRGGVAELPKSKSGKIKFEVFSDRFQLTPTMGSRGYWRDLEIPFGDVRAFEVVDRVVNTFQALAGGLNSRQLNRKNNLHITFLRDGHETLLRLEMISGVTVMGQAKKCLELEDRLRVNGIYGKFGASDASSSVSPPVDILDQIAKLATLRDRGALTDEEFDAKKGELLSRL
jgi:hypothetical protein